MTEVLLTAAGFVIAMVALGLLRIARGPAEADRMMAAQLLGTGGIATSLLVAEATGESAVTDVALALALVASFASAVFARSALAAEQPERRDA